MQIALRSLLIFFLSLNLSWAENSSWYVKKEKHLTLEASLFLSSTCPHCQKAAAFFKEIEPLYPWLKVKSYLIDKDKEALLYFNLLLKDQENQDFAVPSLFFCNSRWVGFASAQTTGKDLLGALDYCRQQIGKKGFLDETTISVLRHWAQANLFDTHMTEQVSASRYLLSLSLMDAFNPCAFFVLIGFLAFIFLGGKAWEQGLRGILFLLALVWMHWLQQARPECFYEGLAWMRVPAALTGLGLLFVLFQFLRRRPPPQLLLYPLAFLSGLFLQMYQQTCLMNWSTIFQQWLSNQQLSALGRHWYQFAYQTLYLLPLTASLILYLFLRRSKFFAQLEARFHFISQLYLLILGSLLIFYPWLLSNWFLSLMLLFFLGLLSWLLNRYYNKE